MEDVVKYDKLNKERKGIKNFISYLSDNLIEIKTIIDYNSKLNNSYIYLYYTEILECESSIKKLQKSIIKIEDEIKLLNGLVKVADEELSLYTDDSDEEKKNSLINDKNFFIQEIDRLSLILNQEKRNLQAKQQLKNKIVVKLNEREASVNCQAYKNYINNLNEELLLIENYIKDLKSIEKFLPVITSIKNDNLSNTLYQNLNKIKKNKEFYQDIESRMLTIKKDIHNFENITKNNVSDDINKYEQLILTCNHQIEDINSMINNVINNYKGNKKYLECLNNRKKTIDKKINMYQNKLRNIQDYSNKLNFDLLNYKKIDIVLKQRFNSLEKIQTFYRDIEKLIVDIGNKQKKEDEYKITAVEDTKKPNDYDDYIFFNYECYDKQRKELNRQFRKNKTKLKKHNEINQIEQSKKLRNIDLTSDIIDNNMTTKKRKPLKIKNVKKSSKWSEIKKSIRKNLNKVIVGVLVGIVALSGLSIQTDSGQIKNYKNIDIIETVDTTSPTTSFNDLKEQNVDCNSQVNFNNINKNQEKEMNLSTLNIGDYVEADGNIYEKAKEAKNEEDGMPQYYSSDDERSISAIAYEVNNQQVIITKDNKDKIRELENMKCEVISYCLSNDEQNIEYEGWYNIDDVKIKSIK